LAFSVNKFFSAPSANSAVYVMSSAFGVNKFFSAPSANLAV